MKKIKNRKNGVRLIAFVMLVALLFSVLASTVSAETCTTGHRGKKTGKVKDATCTEEGYIEYKCTKCDELYYKPVAKLAHIYGEYRSVDGNYTRKICVVCGESYVLDATGARVDDASAIDFPIFAATFEGIETLADITAMFGGFSMTPYMANIIKTDPSGEVYLNVPSGSVQYAPNGYIEVVDRGAQLVGKAFALEFLAFYDEFPTKETALLTWTVDGSAYTLLSADKGGKYLDASGREVAETKGKGWDSIKVEFDGLGGYAVYLNGSQIATGTVATSGASSVLRFFDNKNQFEAYIDEIVIYGEDIEPIPTPVPKPEEADYRAVIDSRAVNAGETFTLDISFEGELPIKTVGVFNISYNRAAFELVSGEWSTEQTPMIQIFDKNDLSALTFEDNVAVSDLKLTLTFKALKGANGGDYRVDCDIMVTKMDGVVEQPLTTAVTEGKISVAEYIRGDVNDDGQVNSNDAIHLLRHSLMPSQYPINQSGDMNGDGQVNSNDAIYLLRHTLIPSGYPLH